MPLFEALTNHIMRCRCGKHPKIETARAAEDLVMIWLECECGRRGELVEDAMIFSGMAEDAVEAWNREQVPAP